MKQFMKEATEDLLYLASYLIGATLAFIAFIYECYREASPREQGFLLGVFCTFSFLLTLSVLAVPPLP